MRDAWGAQLSDSVFFFLMFIYLGWEGEEGQRERETEDLKQALG